MSDVGGLSGATKYVSPSMPVCAYACVCVDSAPSGVGRGVRTPDLRLSSPTEAHIYGFRIPINNKKESVGGVCSGTLRIYEQCDILFATWCIK